MRIAIVGTRPPNRGQLIRQWAGQAAYERDLADYQLITADVLRVLKVRLLRGPFTIVTGGAKGVDSLAEQFALHHGLPCIVIEPDYPSWPPKTAPIIRNGVICAEADAMVAWPKRRRGGTDNAIEWAERWGLPIVVRRPWHHGPPSGSPPKEKPPLGAPHAEWQARAETSKTSSTR